MKTVVTKHLMRSRETSGAPILWCSTNRTRCHGKYWREEIKLKTFNTIFSKIHVIEDNTRKTSYNTIYIITIKLLKTIKNIKNNTNTIQILKTL